MPEIVGIGTDMCEIARMERAIKRAHFYERVFFPEERAYLERKGKLKASSAAAMFAAKEAVAKALGTGFAGGVMPWTICVTHGDAGAPGVVLTLGALERLHALGGEDVLLSLSHESGMALAFALIRGRSRE